MKKLTAKKLMRQLHLWLGLASGLVVVIVALTGCLLVFEKELEEWVDRKNYFVEVPANAQRQPLDNMMQSIQTKYPKLKITRVFSETDHAERSFIFYGKFGKADQQMIFVNPYTAEVIKLVDYKKRFFTIVLDLHRRLLMDEAGKAITGVSCMIFLVMIITGIVLWWPKRWKMLKQRLAIKASGSRKRFNWDLHAVGGFYVHLILFCIALTGLTWSYKWFNNGIFLVFDGKPYKKLEPPVSKAKEPIAYGFYEKIYNEGNKRLSYKGEVNITIYEQDSLGVLFLKENHEASISNVADMLYFEKGTGKLLKEQLYKDISLGWKARRIVYPIHTGQLYGLPTRIMALLACMVAVSLPITGLYIWLGRKKKTSKATKKKPQPASVNAPQQAVVV